MQIVPVFNAWIYSAIVMVVLFLINCGIANMILFRPNNPGTGTRRLWFWLLAVLTFVLGFGINWVIAENIKVQNAHDDYIMHAGISALVMFVVYVGLGFALSKLFPSSKIGTWF